jgi:hypothetical protein
MDWESIWHRASKDTERLRRSKKWYWAVDVMGGGAVFAGIGGWLGWRLTPLDATISTQVIWPLVGTGIGVILGVAFIYGLVFIWYLFRAPYRQRNEARNKVETLKQELNKVTKGRDEVRAERDVSLAKTKDQIINPVLVLIDEASAKCKRDDHSWFNDERYEGIAYTYEHSDEVGDYGNIRKTSFTKTCKFCGHIESGIIF